MLVRFVSPLRACPPSACLMAVSHFIRNRSVLPCLSCGGVPLHQTPVCPPLSYGGVPLHQTPVCPLLSYGGVPLHQTPALPCFMAVPLHQIPVCPPLSYGGVPLHQTPALPCLMEVSHFIRHRSWRGFSRCPILSDTGPGVDFRGIPFH